MPLLALIGGVGGVHLAPPPGFAADPGPGLVFNGFWIAIAAVNFLFFLYVIQRVSFGPVSRMLAERRSRIEQGLKDAEQARADRENAEQERLAALSEARREANDILARAQKVAQETRDADIAATREELERLRARATDDIAAEKQRALSELRTEVADLALRAAGAVVRESMTGERQRRLVEEFLAEGATSGGPGGGSKAS
jgi:F-type H+-transporting ATPase subunit b